MWWWISVLVLVAYIVVWSMLRVGKQADAAMKREGES